MVKKFKSYHIITIGCQMNKSDSERLAGYLENEGAKEAKKREKADLIVINTCGVRQSAEDRVYGLVKKIREDNPRSKLAITGCLAKREDVQARLAGKIDFWILITEISNFKFLISKQFKNIKTKDGIKIRNPKSEIKSSNNCDYLNKEPKYSSSFTAFIPIGNGCDNFCSYCVVPYARGRETWRPAADILKEVRDLVGQGYKEITLIAQNVNSYKSQIATDDDRYSQVNFAKLLKIINAIPGEFWVRFATSHPKDMSDELIKTVALCEKLCEHVHLPVQAGDDGVLKVMNRKYTVKRYIGLINKIRKEIQSSKHKFQINSKFKIQNSKFYQPPASITTDVIVGFPGETRKQFENTKKLFREIKFDQAFIARYSPRPGTAAEKFKDDVALPEKKRREKELVKILRQSALANNKKYLGKTVEVLLEGKNRKGEWFGRTRTNKNVRVIGKNARLKAGIFVKAEIFGAREYGLTGKINPGT